MSFSATVTVAVTSTGGPFPPSYIAGASGFTAAASNPGGYSAGSLSSGTYIGATIAAFCNDAASATELLFALEGTYDQTFIGTITTPDGKTYDPAKAVFEQNLVNGSTITLWIWPLASGASALATGTFSIGNTGDQLVTLSGSAPSSTQINLTWTNSGPTPTEYLLYRGIGGVTPTLYQTLANSVTSYNDTGLAASQQYEYYVIATYAGGDTTTTATVTAGTFASNAQIGTNSQAGNVGSQDGFAVSAIGSHLSPGVGSVSGTISGETIYGFAQCRSDSVDDPSEVYFICDNALGEGTGIELLYPNTSAGNSTTILNTASVGSNVTELGSPYLAFSLGTDDPDYTAGSIVLTFRTPNSGNLHAESNSLDVTTPASGISDSFNGVCESIPLPSDGWRTDTLANLRKRVLIRCGYAAQSSNPPPGMKDLVNEFLKDAQFQLYRQHKEFRNKRLYAWQMVVNQRYYGFDTDESDCRRLDPMSIEWVGFEDLNQAWYELIEGIDPVMYTRAQISTGWPTHYEIRSSIEIFPAPRAPYTLWIKGWFGLDPFTADTDTTTIDAEGVYLLAAGLLKAHYGQPDAQAVLNQAANYTKYIVAGQHGSRRYVPRTRVQTPLTPPRFLPLGP